MTVRGMGWAMASMYSMSRRASTQPPASHTLGLLPPMVVSTVAVTPQAVPKDSRSVLSSAGGANKEIKLVQIDIRKRGERERLTVLVLELSDGHGVAGSEGSHVVEVVRGAEHIGLK
jgi:hypothetical protein